MVDSRAKIGLVTKNAWRLLDDAELLIEHRRFASAVSLATIALEEVGKAVLLHWQVDQDGGGRERQRYHLKKQAAVGYLFEAEVGVKFVAEYFQRQGLPSPTEATAWTDVNILPEMRQVHQSPALREFVAQGLLQAPERRFGEHVRMGVIEKQKHIALYIDDWQLEHGFAPEHFGESDARRLVDEGKRALQLLGNSKIVEVARALYLISRKANVTPFTPASAEDSAHLSP